MEVQMVTTPVIEIFCDGCPWYEPDWSYPCEAVSLPCKHDHICTGNAKKVEILLKEGNE
jgi:hypothetical protein